MPIRTTRRDPHAGRRRASGALGIAPCILLSVAVAGCEYRPGGGARAPGGDTAHDSTARDSVPPVPPVVVPTVSVDTTAAGVAAPGSAALAADPAGGAADVLLAPDPPRRGDVVFALLGRPDSAAGDAGDGVRCRWAGRALPCHAAAGGVLALAPVSADDSAGTYELVADGVPPAGGRIARRVGVAERDFGRELVFLRRDLYARTRAPAAARDARALRSVLAGESAERRWSGAWREPVSGAGVARGTGYGVERFYHPASDSGRVATIAPAARARGGFGVDTGAPGAADVPAWRHAGVDLAVARGSAVRAPAAGQVVDVGTYALAGRAVVVDHGQGVMTAYFHLDTAAVRRGDVVEAGRLLGRVGASGLATGPHLHFGVYVHGRDVDPASWYAMPAWVADAARPPGRAGSVPPRP